MNPENQPVLAALLREGRNNNKKWTGRWPQSPRLSVASAQV